MNCIICDESISATVNAAGTGSVVAYFGLTDDRVMCMACYERALIYAAKAARIDEKIFTYQHDLGGKVTG